METPYSKPGPLGGKLIRTLVKNFRATEGSIGSPILCAVSGGPDSLALAALLLKYGRKVAPPERITLLYIDHGWRPEATPREAARVKKLAKRFGAAFCAEKIVWKEAYQAGESAEARARTERRRIFRRVLKDLGATHVWTAHHADDLAETILWRLFTGTYREQAAGIRRQTEIEFRPLLDVRKAELLGFLKEEKLTYSRDVSNQDSRFLRVRMRQDLMPKIEALFPKAVTHLMTLALTAPDSEQSTPPKRADGGGDLAVKNIRDALRIFSEANEIRLKPSHWRQILAQKVDSNWQGEIHLPGRWKLVRDPQGK